MLGTAHHGHCTPIAILPASDRLQDISKMETLYPITNSQRMSAHMIAGRARQIKIWRLPQIDLETGSPKRSQISGPCLSVAWKSSYRKKNWWEVLIEINKNAQ